MSTLIFKQPWRECPNKALTAAGYTVLLRTRSAAFPTWTVTLKEPYDADAETALRAVVKAEGWTWVSWEDAP